MMTVAPIFGLANRMRAIDSAIALAAHFEQPLKIVWVKNHTLNCAFHELFEPIGGVQVQELTRQPFWLRNGSPRNLFLPKIIRKALGITLHSAQIDRRMVDHTFDCAQLTFDKHIAIIAGERFYNFSGRKFQHFVPTRALRERIIAESSAFDENTIGVHIRRGDNLHSIEHSPFEDFVKSMKEMVDSNEKASFYVASDSVEIKQRLVTLFGDRIHTNFEKSDRASEDGMKEALIELYTLANTKKILGSYWSSFSEVASEIRSIPLEIVKCNTP